MRQHYVKDRSANRSAVKTLIILALLFSGSSAVWAQVRTVGAIAGTVSDSSGAVVANAKVQLKDELTGIQKETVTNNAGTFLFPDLTFGSYQVTVSAPGFQTAVYQKVVVESSRTTDLVITLQVGAVDAIIQVDGAAPTLEITSNLISGTINNKEIQELPLNGRSAFVYARLSPGSATPVGTGDTHYNGLPGGTINATTDGINNASNGFKSGGTSFFGTVPPRLGAVEEVTVETGGMGADSGAQGAVNLKFITRRGSNQYHGSAFEQIRNEAFNANSFFNNARGLPKPKVRRNEFGGNFGGPFPLPFWKLKEKLFFFINFEAEHIPGTTNQSRTVLTQEAQQGIFRYQTVTGEQRTTNILQIAAQNGFPSTLDPAIANILSKQNAALANGQVSNNDLRTQILNWVEPSKQINAYPTVRLDYHITPRLSWMGAWNLYHQDNQGRRLWPLPDQPVQNKFRASWWITSTGLNWTISTNTFNEFRYGIQHSGDTIPNSDPIVYSANGTINGKLFRLTGLPFGLQDMVQPQSPVTGRHYITTIYDTATLIRGNHSIKIGAAVRFTDWHDTSFNGISGILTVPQYNLSPATGDPVSSIFNATTLPGIQSADLNGVNQLYSFLTGRVSRVRSDRVVDVDTLQYSDNTLRHTWTTSKMAGVYAQDQWRVKPNLTLNYGLRWEFQGAQYNNNGIAVFPDLANLLGPSLALFRPGALDGVANPVMKRGKYAYTADLVNPAPNFGFAWNPKFDGGLLGKIFGKDHKMVLRGSFAIQVYDEGTNMFASNPGSNPGLIQSLDLRAGTNFPLGSLTLQSPLPPFQVFPPAYTDTFNMSDLTFSGNTIATMDANLRAPYVQQWNFGIQREIMKNTVIEASYVGNRSVRGWRTFNLHEVNIIENGFLEEFKNAQRNLQINQAAGVNSFANRGLPGQVPLPIFEAAFGPRGSQPALPANQGFSNGAFITNLQQGTAGALAASLAGNSTYLCRMVGNRLGPCNSGALAFNAPGPYPINFFQANPYLAGSRLNFVDDVGYSNYHGLQVQLRRRHLSGLSLTVNYTYSKAIANTWANNATQSADFFTLRDPKRDKGPSPHDLRHVFQAYWTYDLPLGKGRLLQISNRFLDAVIGGWTLGGILTAQSGNVFRLASGRATFNALDSGVLLAGGLTRNDLQQMITVSPGPGFNRYFFDPRLIGPDGRANTQFLQVPTEPGQLGGIIFLYGKNSFNLDASLVKRVRLTEQTNFTIWVGAFNVLNHPVWGPGGFLQSLSIQSTTFGQTTGPINSARSMQMRASINF